MEEEFRQIERKNAWQNLFLEIRDEAEKHEFSHSDAKKKENKGFNRYRDVVPYDHSRIKLTRGCMDYINANLIPVDEAGRRYILTQGPLPNTVSHFWAMVWEQSSKAILMLNGLVERGYVKCHQYWPTKLNELTSHNDVKLSTELIDEEETEHFVTRKINLTDLTTGQCREILQFHYTSWPDFGLPESPSSFLQFLFAVRESGSLDLSKCGPPIVHCSAGIGRSGTLCLVDSCLVLIEKHGNSANVDVKKILLEMRSHRMGLIQTPEQLRFSYMAIIEGIQALIPNKNPATNTNSNGNNDPTESKLNKINKTSDESPFLSPPRDATNGINNDEQRETDLLLRPRPSGSDLRNRTQTGPSPATASPATSKPSSPINGSSLSTDQDEKNKTLREERRKRTLDNISRIKEKQKEVEARTRFKEKIIRFAGWGLAAVLLGTGFVYYWNSASSASLPTSSTTTTSPLRVVSKMTNNSN